MRSWLKLSWLMGIWLCIIFFNRTYAQANKQNQYSGYLGFGIINTLADAKHAQNVFPILFGFNYGLTQKVQIQGMLLYSQYEQSLAPLPTSAENHFFQLGLKTGYQPDVFLIDDKISLQVNAGFGLSYRRLVFVQGYSPSLDPKQFRSFYLATVTARYALLSNFGFFIEAGISPSPINLGFLMVF